VRPRGQAPGHGRAQSLQHLPDTAHLRGIGLRQPAGPVPEGILQPDADIAAHCSRHGGDRQLVAACPEHRPDVAVAEQPVGGTLHVRDIVRMRADAAQDAEDRLDEERPIDETAIAEMGEVVEMAGVVALELEPRTVAAAVFDDVLYVLEGVLEHGIAGLLEILRLPFMQEFFVSVEHRMEAEVH